MQVSRSFNAVSSSILLKYCLAITVRIFWCAASVFLFNCIIWCSVFPLWLSISPRYLQLSSLFSPRYMFGLVVSVYHSNKHANGQFLVFLSQQ